MVEAILSGSIGAGLLLLAFMSRSQRRLLRRAPAAEPADLPGISVLKPLKGVDPSLESNLATFMDQDYPEYEVLFGAADPRDPALDVARRIAASHLRTRSSVHAHARTEGVNPKVANLARLVPSARFPVILVSDSNVAVPRGYLRDMAARLSEPGTGLVSSPILGVPGRGIGAAMESLHLNTFVMGGVAALASLPGGVCVVGKSMMIRRDDLEAMGGFRFLGGFLAEDQVCGEETARRGKGAAVTGVPVHNVLGSFGLRRFASRHLRWARIRSRMCPAGYAAEILLNPILLAAAGASALRTPSSLALLGAAVLLKCALDAAAERTAGFRRPLHHYLLLVPAKDLLVGLLWPVAFLGSTVEWRGARFRIGARTRLEPVGGAAEERHGPPPEAAPFPAAAA